MLAWLAAQRAGDVRGDAVGAAAQGLAAGAADRRVRTPSPATRRRPCCTTSPADGWDDDVVDALGLDARVLPPVLPPSGSPAGALTAGRRRAARAAGGHPGRGRRRRTPQRPRSAPAWSSPGTAQLTIGTGVQIVTPVGPALPDRAPLTRSRTCTGRRPTRAGTRWVPSSTAGSTLRLGLRRRSARRWPELYASAAPAPGADDPFFLPHLHGERTPYLDAWHARRLDRAGPAARPGATCCGPRSRASPSPSADALERPVPRRSRRGPPAAGRRWHDRSRLAPDARRRPRRRARGGRRARPPPAAVPRCSGPGPPG